jgi:hypothetical protein
VDDGSDSRVEAKAEGGTLRPALGIHLTPRKCASFLSAYTTECWAGLLDRSRIRSGCTTIAVFIDKIGLKVNRRLQQRASLYYQHIRLFV